MAKSKIRNIAILTGGGDCPGLNAVIRAVTKTAINKYHLNVFGIEDGYRGLIENRIFPLTFANASGILDVGGTILGSCNKSNPFKFPVKTASGKTVMQDVSDLCIQNLAEKNVDALICVGGDGTMTSAADFAKKGMPVMGVPKTIDNDVYGTDTTFGFDTAVYTATDALDKLHTTASSHHRIMIVEVMGRYAGWIALYSGIAGGADVILMPEFPYDIKKVCDYVIERGKVGKKFSIIVVAEGAKPKGGHMVISKTDNNSPDPIKLGGIANVLSEQIGHLTGLDTRATILGHVQRGGTPTPRDRQLGTMFGYLAVDYLMKGVKNQLVILNDNHPGCVPLAKIRGKIKTVKPNDPMVLAAKAVKTSFGV